MSSQGFVGFRGYVIVSDVQLWDVKYIDVIIRRLSYYIPHPNNTP